MSKQRKKTGNLLDNIVSQAAQQQQPETALAPPTPPQESSEKTRVNHYISTEVLDTLDESWLALRKMTKKKRVSKSQIVEAALIMALDDFKKNGDKSQVAKHLSR